MRVCMVDGAQLVDEQEIVESDPDASTPLASRSTPGP